MAARAADLRTIGESSSIRLGSDEAGVMRTLVQPLALVWFFETPPVGLEPTTGCLEGIGSKAVGIRVKQLEKPGQNSL